MIIDQYWGHYFGDSPDSIVLVNYLDTKNTEVDLIKIFADLRLDELAGDYTTADITTTVDGITYHFNSAFQVILDLSVLLLESRRVGAFDLARIGGPNSRLLCITAESHESVQITTALKYFALMPERHRLADNLDEDQRYELGNLCEEIRGQLD